MKLRAYCLPHADGVNHLLVAAKNQKEACRLMNVPVGYFRRFGGHAVKGAALVVALSEPGVVWKQRGDMVTPQPWVKA